jgi:hypothetical protein
VPVGLSQIARQLLLDEAKLRREQTCPLLVWEAPPTEQQEPVLFGTNSEVQLTRPRAGVGLVFQVQKVLHKSNAFPMGVTLGRTENNDIVIGDNTVSRLHGFFTQDLHTREWSLTDAETTCGTWLGLSKLAPNRPRILPKSARIKVGAIELFFFMPEVFFEYLQGHMRP